MTDLRSNACPDREIYERLRSAAAHAPVQADRRVCNAYLEAVSLHLAGMHGSEFACPNQ